MTDVYRNSVVNYYYYFLYSSLELDGPRFALCFLFAGMGVKTYFALLLFSVPWCSLPRSARGREGGMWVQSNEVVWGEWLTQRTEEHCSCRACFDLTQEMGPETVCICINRRFRDDCRNLSWRIVIWHKLQQRHTRRPTHTHIQCLQEPLSLWFGVKHADVSCQSCVSIEIQSAALLGYEFSPDDCTDYRFNEEVGNPVMTGSLIVCP